MITDEEQVSDSWVTPGVSHSASLVSVYSLCLYPSTVSWSGSALRVFTSLWRRFAAPLAFCVFKINRKIINFTGSWSLRGLPARGFNTINCRSCHPLYQNWHVQSLLKLISTKCMLRHGQILILHLVCWLHHSTGEAQQFLNLFNWCWCKIQGFVSWLIVCLVYCLPIRIKRTCS